MTRAPRRAGLAVALVVVVASLLAVAGPAEAEQSNAAGARATALSDAVVPARPSGPVKPTGPYVNYMGHDYCGGWLTGPQWCLTFNRSEAGYLSSISVSAGALFICAATALVGCAVATVMSEAIKRYLDRNGYCPKSRPKMRVTYIPIPGRVSCD